MSIQLVVCTTRAFFELLQVPDKEKKLALDAFAGFLSQTPEWANVDIENKKDYGTFDLFTKGGDILRRVVVAKSAALAEALSHGVHIPVSCSGGHVSRKFVHSTTKGDLELDVCDMDWLAEAVSFAGVALSDEPVSVERELLADAVEVYGTAISLARKKVCPIFLSY